MSYSSSLKRSALGGVIDSILETTDELEDALSALQHPRDLLCEEDLAQEDIKRCPRCRKWVNESDCDDIDTGCYLCSATED